MIYCVVGRFWVSVNTISRSDQHHTHQWKISGCMIIALLLVVWLLVLAPPWQRSILLRHTF